MGFWGKLMKGAGTVIKSTGSAVVHPIKTVGRAGTVMKSVAVGGAATYIGWEKLTTDKSVARIVGDALVGEETVDKMSSAVDDVKELKDKAGDAVDSVNSAMGDVNSIWGGMTNFFKGMFNGDGFNMFGNFFKNMANGNVSGLSIAGLVAAAFMVFGRFGWLAKIAGALLGFMLLGNNMRAQQQTPAVAKTPTPVRESPAVEAVAEAREVVHRR